MALHAATEIQEHPSFIVPEAFEGDHAIFSSRNSTLSVAPSGKISSTVWTSAGLKTIVGVVLEKPINFY